MTEKIQPLPWHSTHEYVPTKSDNILVEKLSDVDSVIASQASESFGKRNQRKQILPVRIIRRLYYEFSRPLRPFVVKVGRFLDRNCFKLVQRFLLFPSGRRTTGSSDVEIHHLSDGVADLEMSLSSTSASHWILVREPGTLFKSAVSLLTQTAKNPKIRIAIGDSRTSSGAKVFRPKFSRLVARQVDTLGPVILCKVADLRAIASRYSPEIWPLALALDVDEESVRNLPEMLGIGNLVASLSEGGQNVALNLVRAELERMDLSATVGQISGNIRRVNYARNSLEPLVSIIIPTRGSGKGGQTFVVDAVDSILARSTYKNFEIIVVADSATPQNAIDTLEKLNSGKLQLVRWEEAFNFSKKMNLGAVISRGEYLLFLNDDIEVVSADWIQNMLGLIGHDSIGYVGSLLFFDDLSVQHAGHFYAGGAGHIGFKKPFRISDPNQALDIDRIVSGVTAACSLMPRKIFEQIGGFSTDFPGNYNDVDLAMKVGFLGYRCAVSGESRLYHFESKTRDATVLKSEVRALHSRWYSALQTDPWFRAQEE